MRIVQLLEGRVNNALGGTEKVFIDMANAMTERGHSVACIYFDEDISEGNNHILFKLNNKAVVINCYRPFQYSLKKKLRKLSTFFVFNSKKRRILRNSVKDEMMTKYIAAYKPDIVIVYYPMYDIHSVKKMNIPIIQMMHFMPSCEYYQDAKEYLEQGDCIQVLMPEYIQEARKLYNHDHITYIPNVVPQYAEQSDLTDKTVIFIGRIAKQKRPDLIIESWALLKDKYPDWKAELWGEDHFEPDMTEKVKSLIKHYKLQNCVLLRGTTLDVPGTLKKASVMLMPSAYEGFGLAATEGMSMGLPLVACKDCPALNTLVRHNENGFLCDPDPQDIARRLDMLIGDDALRKRLGAQAKKDMKQYRPELVYDQWEALMHEVIERKKNGNK